MRAGQSVAAAATEFRRNRKHRILLQQQTRPRVIDDAHDDFWSWIFFLGHFVHVAGILSNDITCRAALWTENKQTQRDRNTARTRDTRLRHPSRASTRPWYRPVNYPPSYVSVRPRRRLLSAVAVSLFWCKQRELLPPPAAAL